MPWRAQTRLTASILAMETGWPPPELLVTVSIASGMLGAPSETMRDSSAATSMLPLKSRRACVSAASGMGRSTARAPVNSILAPGGFQCGVRGNGQIHGARAGELDIGSGGIEMRVRRHHLSGLAHHGEENAFGGATLVRGDDMAEAGEIAGHAFE